MRTLESKKSANSVQKPCDANRRCECSLRFGGVLRSLCVLVWFLMVVVAAHQVEDEDKINRFLDWASENGADFGAFGWPVSCYLYAGIESSTQCSPQF